jgi:hypothetical protein
MPVSTGMFQPYLLDSAFGAPLNGTWPGPDAAASPIPDVIPSRSASFLPPGSFFRSAYSPLLSASRSPSFVQTSWIAIVTPIGPNSFSAVSRDSSSPTPVEPAATSAPAAPVAMIPSALKLAASAATLLTRNPVSRISNALRQPPTARATSSAAPATERRSRPSRSRSFRRRSDSNAAFSASVNLLSSRASTGSTRCPMTSCACSHAAENLSAAPAAVRPYAAACPA